jgi:hypothetical protein
MKEDSWWWWMAREAGSVRGKTHKAFENLFPWCSQTYLFTNSHVEIARLAVDNLVKPKLFNGSQNEKGL